MSLIPYPSTAPDHLPVNYGSYHQMYRLDGKLIAMSVLDILPSCVSSVYFMYDDAWERFSLGKVSAMREAALAKEIHDAGVHSIDALYLGFYVHSCPKMRYKGEYHPSYLADPEIYTWWPFKECLPLLDKFHYACFAHPEHSLSEPAVGANPIPVYPSQLLKEIHVEVDQPQRQRVITPLDGIDHWYMTRSRDCMLVIIDNLSLEVSKRMIFQISRWMLFQL